MASSSAGCSPPPPPPPPSFLSPLTNRSKTYDAAFSPPPSHHLHSSNTQFFRSHSSATHSSNSKMMNPPPPPSFLFRRSRSQESTSGLLFSPNSLFPTHAHTHNTSPAVLLQSPPPPPPLGPTSLTMMESVRYWYGNLINSYFAFPLLWSSLLLFLTVTSIILVVTLAQPHSSYDDAKAMDQRKQELVDDCDEYMQSIRVFFYVNTLNVFLVGPVIFPRTCRLFSYCPDRHKIIRSWYIHICELIVVILVIYLISYGTNFAINVYDRTIFSCFNTANKDRIFVISASMLTWCFVWMQITAFSRFRAHLKMQFGSMSKSRHSSNFKSLWRRFSNSMYCTKEASIEQYFRYNIYKAASRDDLNKLEDLVEDAKVQLGETFVRDMYKCPRLWFWSFAKSCKNPLHAACMSGNLKAITYLLDAGFEVDALDKVSRVNFSLSLLFKLTRLLIRTQECDMRSPIKSLFCSVLVSPLHVAVNGGDVETVRLLLDYNASVNLQSKASFYNQTSVLTPIFLANHRQVLKLLLLSGANHLAVPSAPSFLPPYSIPRGGMMSVTVLQHNMFHRNNSMVALLAHWGADVALTPLHAAAAQNHVELIDWLLSKNVNVDTLGEVKTIGFQNRTALHWAAIVGSTDAAKILLAHGADPNALDRQERNPLHWASRNNHSEIVKLLISHGSESNWRDRQGFPVLCFAALNEGISIGVCQSLVQRGNADINASIETGDTALHLALQHENRETAISLLRCGADIMKTNSSGKRAVDVTTSTDIRYWVKKEAGMREVMISYTHVHAQLACEIQKLLIEEFNITVWMDRMDPSGIGGGAIWRQEIANGIQHASLVLAIVCEGYGRSQWCLKELAYAKLMQTPVLALVVESLGLSKELDCYIPPTCRVEFGSFIQGHELVSPQRVLFSINKAKLKQELATIIPVIKEKISKYHRQQSAYSSGTSSFLETNSHAYHTNTSMSPINEHDEKVPIVYICFNTKYNLSKQFESETSSKKLRENGCSSSIAGGTLTPPNSSTSNFSDKANTNEIQMLNFSRRIRKELQEVGCFVIPQEKNDEAIDSFMQKKHWQSNYQSVHAKEIIEKASVVIAILCEQEKGVIESSGLNEAHDAFFQMQLDHANFIGRSIVPLIYSDFSLGSSKMYSLSRSRLVHFYKRNEMQHSFSELMSQFTVNETISSPALLASNNSPSGARRRKNSSCGSSSHSISMLELGRSVSLDTQKESDPGLSVKKQKSYRRFNSSFDVKTT